MSGVGVDHCVGAREPNPVRIQIASATGGGNCSVCTGAVVSRAPDRGWCPVDVACSTPTSDRLRELPECREGGFCGAGLVFCR